MSETNTNGTATYVGIAASIARMPGALRGGFTTTMGLSSAQARFVSGPLVVHGSEDEAAVVPEWMRIQAVEERVEIVLREQDTGRSSEDVGPTELAAVMMPASLAVKFEADMSALYCWATIRSVARHTGQEPSEVARAINASLTPDHEVTEPEGRLYPVYSRLAAQVRERVVAAAPA